MNPHELMTAAYSMLYEIETTLAKIIESNMKIHYGLGWQQRLRLRRNFNTLYFHELIAFFGKYPSTLPHFTEHQRNQLYDIVPIRNKVCHMKNLNIKEYKALKDVHRLIRRIEVVGQLVYNSSNH